MEQLTFARGTYRNGFEISKEAVTMAPINAAQVFDSTCSVTPARKALPPPAFLVPAVLDALRTSKYASVTSVVPGEADLFCARAALEPGRIIFTNDSDLLLYDLGTFGEVVFFKDLELRSSHETSNSCATLYAYVSQPAKIASRLGLRGLRRLAFEIKEDISINLGAAVMLAKKSVATIGPQAPAIRRDAFKAFEKEYDIQFSGFEAITWTAMTFGTDVSRGSFLDPRMSELVSRSPYPSSIFLPFLTDEWSRSPAWDVSRELRHFSYSCLVFKNTDTKAEQVSEHFRRGPRMVRDDIVLLSPTESIEYATTLAAKIESLTAVVADFSTTHAIWRCFALCEVSSWYLNNGKKLPSRDTLTAVFSGTAKDQQQMSWSEIHISAQLQAVLYSLRMLHQILSHLVVDAQEMIQTGKPVRAGTLTENPSDFECSLLEFSYEQPKPLPAELLHLEALLSTLPLLGGLIPSRLELMTTHAMPAVEVEYLFDVLATCIQLDSDNGEGSSTASQKGKTADRTSSENIQVAGVRKSEGGNDGQGGTDPNNRFDVLGFE